MKLISKEEIQLLIKNRIIKNTNGGYISLVKKDLTGGQAHVGYYKTVNGRHRYMEDWYVNQANMIRKERNNSDKGNRYLKKEH